jgi:hypothetical protein
MIFMALFPEKKSRYKDFGWNRGSASYAAGASVVALDECAWIISGCSSLCIHVAIRVADRTGKNEGHKRRTPARDLVHFVASKLASAYPAEYAVVVVIRHEFLLSSLRSSPILSENQPDRSVFGHSSY